MNSNQDRLQVLPVPENWYLKWDGCPGTPSKKKMEEIEALLKETMPSQHKAANLTDEERENLDNYRESQKVNLYGDEFLMKLQEQGIPENEELILQQMTLSAHMADTQQTVGVLLTFFKEDDEEIQDQVIPQIAVAKMLRHRNWMGTARFLPLVKGLKTTLIESGLRRGMVGIVVFHPVRGIQEASGVDRIPEGEPRRFADLFTWHGATECRWVEWDQIQEPEER